MQSILLNNKLPKRKRKAHFEWHTMYVNENYAPIEIKRFAMDQSTFRISIQLVDGSFQFCFVNGQFFFSNYCEGVDTPYIFVQNMFFLLFNAMLFKRTHILTECWYWLKAKKNYERTYNLIHAPIHEPTHEEAQFTTAQLLIYS